MYRTIRILSIVLLMEIGLCSLASAQTGYDVVWSDLVGSSVSGNTLTKTVADGWGNSAATGLYYLENNTDGWLEYTVDAINRKAFGLSDLNANTFTGSLDYCFNIGSDAKAYIFNNSVQLGLTPVVIGDILRIERVGSTIYFKKNGSIVHTLAGALTVPLLIDVSLYTAGSALVNMKASFGPSPHPVLQWTDVKGMSVSGDNLLRTNSYAAGYNDSGAASVASLPAGESGWIEVTMNELDRRRMIGFSPSNTFVNPGTIAYGVQFDNDNMNLVVNGVVGAFMGKFTTNSVIRIAREGNQVKYYVNGTHYYTSPTPSTGALYVHVGFFNQLGTFKNIYASFGPGQGTVPDRIEYETLKAFYDSLGGSGWTTKTNWPASGTWPKHMYNTQFNNWYGITIANGDVTKINYNLNNLTGFIPSTIGNLKKLDYFRALNNHITGKIPVSICTLTDLTLLQLGFNELTGQIPSAIGNLTKLTWLGLYENHNLSGSLPSSFYNLTKLTDLYIYDTKIEGSLSEQIGNFDKLVTFYGYQNSWTGNLPAGLGNITTLQNLYLYSNNFSGEIPSNWQNLTNLRNLWLHYIPGLTGQVPTWLGNFTNLQTLAFGDNDLRGTLPASIGNLTNLRELYFFDLDSIEGTIPTTWQNLNKLTRLQVYGNPLVTGSVPAGLANQPTLKSFGLSNSSYTGFPNISARTDKSTISVSISGNQIPVADIERYFTGPNTHAFALFNYGAQRVPEIDSLRHVPLTSALNIEAPSGGTHAVYLWEKLENSTWTNINNQNESSSPNIFAVASTNSAHAGIYRYTVTNTWMPDFRIESGPIEIQITEAINNAPSERLYNGQITAARWRTEKAYGVEGDDLEGMYVYDYDDKYQIAEARFAHASYNTVTGGTFSLSGNKYRTSGMTYDPNGNIQVMKRFDENGIMTNDFAYHYAANKNQLLDVDGYTTQSGGGPHGFAYNAIGQLTDEYLEDGTKQFIEYDVTGKVIAVFSDISKTPASKKVDYLYDDRGFRLAKVSYSENGTEARTTWYHRDISGNILAIYEQEGAPGQGNENTPTQTEVPVYGSGKIGTFYPDQDNSTAYEITDHLGNVRALLRDNVNIYTATMEDNGLQDITNPREQEKQYFENLDETSVSNFVANHTPSSAEVNPAHRVAQLQWNDTPGSTAAEKSMGPAIALQVNPGDKIEAESFAYYFRKTGDFNRNGFTLGMLSSVLGGTFAGEIGFEGSTLSQVTDAFSNALAAGGFLTDNDPTIPYAYINYIVFDENMISIASDFKRVTGESFEDPTIKHERVAFDAPIVIGPDGRYIYVWVSCESSNTQIWFDDVKVTHTSPAMIVRATDYGVWGDVLREQKTDESKYRFGYQGQFAEKDDETGWNHFELREYDPTIGRWLVPDPFRQHASPYVAFGNNPVNKIDKNGGTDGPFGSGCNCIDVKPGPRSTVVGNEIWMVDDYNNWAKLLDEVETEIETEASVFALPLAGSIRIPGWVTGTATWLSVVWATSELLRSDESEKKVTLYRGVHVGHPDYANALRGMAVPFGGTATDEMHNGGNFESVFTSWSMSKSVANWHANKHGPGGLVLEKKFRWSETVPSLDEYQELEVLIPGTVSGAKVGPPTGVGTPKAFGN
ncbi:MAG TPA: RHS repeat-associated core domain-containing protein [Ohtaekwangia sp.]